MSDVHDLLIDANRHCMELISKLTAETQARKQAEQERDNTLCEIQRLQPEGSPPPGGVLNHVAWIVNARLKQIDSLNAANAGLQAIIDAVNGWDETAIPCAINCWNDSYPDKAIAAQQRGDKLDGRPVITQEQARKMDCPFPPDEDL